MFTILLKVFLFLQSYVNYDSNDGEYEVEETIEFGPITMSHRDSNVLDWQAMCIDIELPFFKGCYTANAGTEPMGYTGWRIIPPVQHFTADGDEIPF